jgi:hypothetical protein
MILLAPDIFGEDTPTIQLRSLLVIFKNFIFWNLDFQIGR